MDALGRFGLRVFDFSVQGNHLHLIVEADSSESLSRGMQGLCIRAQADARGRVGVWPWRGFLHSRRRQRTCRWILRA